MSESPIGRTNASTGRPASECVLVAVGGSPRSEHLVRAACQLASSLGARWIALHVVTHDSFATSANRERVRSALKLAESLGGEVMTVRGDRPAHTILSFARARGVSKIVSGITTHRTSVARMFRPTLADSLLNEPTDIDVYLVTGSEPALRPDPPGPRGRHSRSDRRIDAKQRIAEVGGTAGIMIAALVVSKLLESWAMAEAVIMIHLLGAFLVGVIYGRLYSLVASVWAVLQFNFFFTAPRHTLIVYDLNYIPVFMTMFVVAGIAATLAARLRMQREITRDQEAGTYQLYLLGQSLAEASGIDEILRVSCTRLSHLFGHEVAVFLPDDAGALTRRATSERYPLSGNDADAAEWCFRNRTIVGNGDEILDSTRPRYEPLRSGESTLGVIGLIAENRTAKAANAPNLSTAVSLVARAIEREWLLEARRSAAIEADTERFRSSLLRSVSHDLRTPLAGISGSAEALVYAAPESESVRSLAGGIAAEAERLTLLVENVLSLTKLQEDPTRFKRSLESVDDLVYATVETARTRYRSRTISPRIEGETAMVEVDPNLIRQALLNFVDNADKYSPPGSPVEVFTENKGGEVIIGVSDRGDGVPEELRERIFEKFVRGGSPDDRSHGSGLGLYICATIARVHAGRIFYEPQECSGTRFCLALPVAEQRSGNGNG